MICRCDWCGKAADEMPGYPIESSGGWISNPFYQREAKFYACSEVCKMETVSYYSKYRATVRIFAGVMAAVFGAAFALAFAYGYPAFRWAVPAAIAVGGAILQVFPYANSFRRDKAGSLKTSLKRSMQEGRFSGFLFIFMALVLAYINFQLPAIFPIQIEAEPPPISEKN